jgi:hypothetical protein
MTRQYQTDADCGRRPERDPALFRREEKYLRPETLFMPIDPKQIRHLRRLQY